jgi:predicted kinase
MVRVTQRTHEVLRKLAEETHQPMQEIVAQAIEQYRRQRILEATNEAYAALRNDAQAWQEIEEERTLWEATLMDGLDPDEHSPAW